MSTFWVSRHAVTTRPGYYWGQTDIPLSPDGRDQAISLAQATRDYRPVEIISSPQRRAYDTAQIVAERLGCGLRSEKRLAARDYGAYTSKKKTDIAELRASQYRTTADRWTWRPPGGETNIEVLERTCDFLESVPLERRLLILHEDSMRILIGALQRDRECLFRRYKNCKPIQCVIRSDTKVSLMSIVEPAYGQN